MQVQKGQNAKALPPDLSGEQGQKVQNVCLCLRQRGGVDGVARRGAATLWIRRRFWQLAEPVAFHEQCEGRCEVVFLVSTAAVECLQDFVGGRLGFVFALESTQHAAGEFHVVTLGGLNKCVLVVSQ